MCVQCLIDIFSVALAELPCSADPGWKSSITVAWERFSLRLKLSLFDWYVAILASFGGTTGRVD